MTSAERERRANGIVFTENSKQVMALNETPSQLAVKEVIFERGSSKVVISGFVKPATAS